MLSLDLSKFNKIYFICLQEHQQKYQFLVATYLKDP